MNPADFRSGARSAQAHPRGDPVLPQHQPARYRLDRACCSGADLMAGATTMRPCSKLVADSPLANLLVHDCTLTDCQPVLTTNVPDSPGTEIQYEVKTRQHGPRARVRTRASPSASISPQEDRAADRSDEMTATYSEPGRQGEHLVEHAMIPALVMPIRRAITAYLTRHQPERRWTQPPTTRCTRCAAEQQRRGLGRCHLGHRADRGGNGPGIILMHLRAS